MSHLPLTPGVIHALRTDFRQGTWSATTQQFFQQLGTESITTEDHTTAIQLLTVGLIEVNADLAVLQAAMVGLQAAIDALEATVAELSHEFSLGPLPHETFDPLTLADLSPRDAEVAVVDFGVGRVPWP